MCQKCTGKHESVGSFLRPEELANARKAFQIGDISQTELTAVEDQAITDLIVNQKK